MKEEENIFEHWERIPMQFLCVRARIVDKQKLPAWMTEDGEIHEISYVSCWIKDQTAKNAQYIVAGNLQETGFTVEEFEEQYDIEREDYEDEDEHLQFFEQAETDYEVFVFNTCPVDAPEE